MVFCSKCGNEETSDKSFCTKCGRPLDLQKALELEEKANQQNFSSNKMALKFLLQMLQTRQIPKIKGKELTLLIQELNA